MAKKKKRPADQYQKPVAGTNARRVASDASGASSDVSAEDSTSRRGGVKTARATGTGGQGSGSDMATAVKSKGKGRATPSANARPNTSTSSSRGMSGNQQWMLLGGAFVLLMVGAIAWSFMRQTGGDGVTTLNAWDLPARADDTRDGENERIMLSNYVGTPTVVTFFSGDCEFCDTDIRNMVANANAYNEQADFLLVNTDDTSRSWRDVAERNGALGVLPIAHDVGGSNRNGLFISIGGSPDALDNGRTNHLPATVYYDRDGSVHSINLSNQDPSVFASNLAEMGVGLPTVTDATVQATSDETGTIVTDTTEDGTISGTVTDNNTADDE